MAQVAGDETESSPDSRHGYRPLECLHPDQGAHGADQARCVNAGVKRYERHRQQRQVEFEAEEFELLVRAYRRSGQRHREQRAEQIDPEDRRGLAVSSSVMISYRRTNISAQVGTTTSASLRTAFNQTGIMARRSPVAASRDTSGISALPNEVVNSPSSGS